MTPIPSASPVTGAFDRSVWRVTGDPLVGPTSAGVLDGLSVAVKDLFAVAGERIGAGNPSWLQTRETEAEHAPVIDRLLGCGAHIVGIAQTDEFAYSLSGTNAHYGTPPNPAFPDGVSGGSTSGPTSAVALCEASIGLGTDTAGSTRVPASYQGLVGIRTTHGVLSTEGVLPLAPSFDAVGWITRDVATSALVAEALFDRGPGATTPGGFDGSTTLRIPVLEAWATPEVRGAFSIVLTALAHEGVIPPIEDVDLRPDLVERWFTAFRTLQGWEAWRSHGTWVSAHRQAVGPDVAERFDTASRVTSDDASAARDEIDAARGEIRDLLDGAVIALPAASGPAVRRSATRAEVEVARTATIHLTFLASVSGAPAVALPLLEAEGGHPVGLSLIGSPGHDRALLDLAGRVVSADALTRYPVVGPPGERTP
jgi:Asp-tRNA(Asn)/Glu-tRNA(Gln) amidotransferase A subunit family amidase